MLRTGVAMCFVGHGAFGIITKPEWLPYFAVAGIGNEGAMTLMPVVGTVDILMGVSALVSPRPLALLYMAAWGLWTALLRPLAGEPVWETIERAGNYGVPLAFLLVAGPFGSVREWCARATWRDWLRPIEIRAPRPAAALRLERLLVWTTGLLLIGHGALGALEARPLLVQLWSAVGAGSRTAGFAGWMEMALGVAVLVRPSVRLAATIAAWKVGTELLFPIAGFPVWELIERGGSYAAPLALALVLAHIDRDILRKRGAA